MKPKIKESDLGQIKIGQAVYATIAAIAARTTHGIAGLASTFNDGVSRLFGAKHDYEGVKVSYTDTGELHMVVYLKVSYGYRIPDLVLRLQEKIKSAVQDYTGIQVQAIDVVVQELIFETASSPKLAESIKEVSHKMEDRSSSDMESSLEDLADQGDPTSQAILETAKSIVLQIPGIDSLSPRRRDEVEDKLITRFGKKNLPGINLKHRKDGWEINLYIKAVYGYNLIEVAKQAQTSIRKGLLDQYQLDNVRVDVHFERLLQEVTQEE